MALTYLIYLDIRNATDSAFVLVKLSGCGNFSPTPFRIPPRQTILLFSPLDCSCCPGKSFRKAVKLPHAAASDLWLKHFDHKLALNIQS